MRRFAPFFLLLFLLVGCGHRGGPTGGPRDTVQPAIASIDPAPFSPLGSLTVTFSKPIDRASLVSGFYTYPPIPRKKLDWKDQTTLRIRFLDELEPDTNYFVTFSSDIACTHGNPLDKTYTYVYRNGALQTGRIAGRIDIDPPLSADLPVGVTLWSADSTRVYDTELEAGPFVLENLNPDRYYLQAWVDRNENGKYEYGVDGWCRTGFLNLNDEPAALRIAIQDTIPPRMSKAFPQWDNLVDVVFKEPVARIDRAGLMSADSLHNEVPVIGWTIRGERVSFLTGRQDSGRYVLRVAGVSDARGNLSRADSLVFECKAIRDTIPPLLETSSPRNGGTVSALRPDLRLLFSEIVPRGRLELSLQAVETGEVVPVEVISADATACVVRPGANLKNYTSYRLTVGRGTADTGGNRLPEPVEIKFITALQDRE